MKMKRKILIICFVIMLVFASFSITNAKSPEKYFENTLFEYGSTYTISDGTPKITSSNSSIAKVSGNTVSIDGTGAFTLTISANSESKTIKCFAWNVCLKSSKCTTYTDSGMTKSAEPLYGRTYLAVTKSGNSFKVNDYLCATGSYSGNLKGKYIVDASNTDDAKNFMFQLSKSGNSYEGMLKSIGLGNGTTEETPTNINNERKILTIKYRIISENGLGEAITGVSDERVAVTEEVTIRRSKNAEIIQKGYEYRGVSIDGSAIDSNAIDAKVNTSNSTVVFWYAVRETTPNKTTEIDLSQLNGVNITVNKSYSPFGNYNYNYGNIDLSSIKSLTKEQAGIIIANFSKYIVSTQKDQWIYSFGMDQTYGKGKAGYGDCKYTPNTYLYKKSSGWAYGTSTWNYGPYKRFSNMYSTDCGGFCVTMYHWALGLGAENQYTYLIYNGYTEDVRHPNYLNMSNAKMYLQPGDIIVYSGHLALYAGNGQITEMQCVGLLNRSINTYRSRKVLGILRLTDSALAQINANLNKVQLQFLFGDKLNASGLSLTTNGDYQNSNEGIFNHTFSGQLIDSYSDSSIDVKIEKYSNLYIVKVWVKDPSQQIRKAEAGWGVQLQNVSQILNATNGAIVGVNGSAFYKNPTWTPDKKWDEDVLKTDWDLTSMGNYVISNGIVKRKLEGTIVKSTIGFTKAGTIKYYEYNPLSDIERDGIINTFTFRPLLIKDGQRYTVTNPNLKKTDYTNKRGRTTIGQVDSNNYIIIMASDDSGQQASLNDIIPVGLELKCKILFNLDGGGSSTLWLRKGKSGSGNKVAGGTRHVAEALYFSSLE